MPSIIASPYHRSLSRRRTALKRTKTSPRTFISSFIPGSLSPRMLFFLSSFSLFGWIFVNFSFFVCFLLLPFFFFFSSNVPIVVKPLVVSVWLTVLVEVAEASVRRSLAITRGLRSKRSQSRTNQCYKKSSTMAAAVNSMKGLHCDANNIFFLQPRRLREYLTCFGDRTQEPCGP